MKSLPQIEKTSPTQGLSRPDLGHGVTARLLEQIQLGGARLQQKNSHQW